MFSLKLIKLYASRLLGIVTSLLSYTIVIPKLSSNVGAYGIYTVVVSLLMLLQFADLGFMGAGQKYAAESYGRDDQEEEISILSFVHFILFVVVGIYAFGLLYVYFNPQVVFNSLTISDAELAKKLILIFIVFAPVIVLQRFVSTVFAIRLEDYFQQIVDISANVMKIASTFYFFQSGKYDLVGYILFMQCMNLMAASIGLLVIRVRYKYNFKSAIRNFHFNKKIFNLTKKMALTSIVLTLAWILYYELDSVYVSKLYNTQTVAFFAIGITMLTFSRTLMNVLFSPFQVKFNHLRGVNDEHSLSSVFLKLIEWSFPISIIPPIVIIILMKPLIFSWIGPNYIDSISISRVLILNLIFAFLSVPISYLAMAREKFRFMLLSSVSLPFVYLVSFLIIRNQVGILALPVAKVLTIFVNLLINLILIKSVISESLSKVLMSISIYIILPILVSFGMLYLAQPLWNISFEKNTFSFLKIVGLGAICAVIPILIYYFINPATRRYLIEFVRVQVIHRLN